ncbi:MAG: O-antigen ligase family protein [Sideroxydans sp.]|nr:O-antigen ligase family protein [Sideroxydans sp.]
MNTATQALGVLMLFVLIFPTALVNVVLLLLLISYFASGCYAEKWQRMRANPVANASLLLFALFVLGMVYSPVNFVEALDYLNNYRELVLLPIAITVFNQAHWQRRAYYAFLAAIGVAVLASFAMRLGWLPPGPPEQDWVPFKGRIAYGFFLAYAIYLMLHHAAQSETNKQKLLWAGFAAVSSLDLLYLVSGRTGHSVFAALLLLLLAQYRVQAKKHWLVIFLALAIISGTVIATSSAIQSREGDMQTLATKPQDSSIGLRLIFWQTSLRIIADHPLLGAGTGSFAHEYSSHAGEYASLNADNPHNEYLIIAAQLGLLGLLGWLWLLYSQFKLSGQLPPLYSVAAQGLVVAMAVGCLFNSFLRDHGEGHFYAIYAGLLFSTFAPEQKAA